MLKLLKEIGCKNPKLIIGILNYLIDYEIGERECENEENKDALESELLNNEEDICEQDINIYRETIEENKEIISDLKLFKEYILDNYKG